MGELATSWPLLLYSCQKELSYPWSRGLGGPGAGLDALEERELLPLPEIKPRFLGHPASCEIPLYGLKVGVRCAVSAYRIVGSKFLYWNC